MFWSRHVRNRRRLVGWRYRPQGATYWMAVSIPDMRIMMRAVAALDYQFPGEFEPLYEEDL